MASQVLNNHSQIVVRLNGSAVHQFSLADETGPFSHQVSLPVDLLAPGFNRVEVEAIQHYTDICEYPTAPQLWTQIDLVNSFFSVAARPRVQAARLTILDSLFDRATWRLKPEVPIFASVSVREQLIGALGLIAQGIGQRYDYVPVNLQLHALPASLTGILDTLPADAPAGVMIATFDELESMGFTHEYPRDRGPIIAVRALPGSGSSYVVLLMGEFLGDITAAAQAFAILNMPWPDADWVAVSQLDVPTPENLERRFGIPTLGEGAFPLRALGYRTQTLSGINAESVFLKVWNNTWQGRMQIRLHLSYGNGMSNQSSLGIITNGVMHGQIPMVDPTGGIYDSYAVTIPAGAMRPGWNSLELRPMMTPGESGGNCQALYSDNLTMTIYDDTTIQKFGGAEYRQADLELISGEGLLFTDSPLGLNIGFHLADNEAETISAAMTLVAKLSQVYDRPLLNSWFGVGANESTRLQFWVGSYAALPSDIRQVISANLPERANFSVPVMQTATIQGNEQYRWFGSLLETMGLRRVVPATTTNVNIELQGGFVGANFAASARTETGGQLVVFSADTPQSLRNGIFEAVDYGMWAQLRGLVSYWTPPAKEVRAVTSEDAPFSAYGLRGGLGLWVSQRPWTSLAVLLVSMLLLATLTQRVLVARQRRLRQNDD